MPSPPATSRRVDNLYLGPSTMFKAFLLGGVLIVSTLFIWYTFSVIEKLQLDTRSQVEKYVKLWQMTANSPTSGTELQFIFEEIIVKATFPIIVLDGNRQPIHWRNIEHIDPADTTLQTRAHLKEMADDMTADHGDFPIQFAENQFNYFCYGDSAVITQLTMMPFIEIAIVLAFVIVAVIGFQNIKRSEERHIWVGMAKETAHQLGTPISSLMGWLEIVEHGESLPPRMVETVENMKVDVGRLQKVANRFGQIGSVPELQQHDLNEIVKETTDYYTRRLPLQGKGTTIMFVPGTIPAIPLNIELFGWALENLVKNALQAVDASSGRITVTTGKSDIDNLVAIQITDNGQGIPVAAQRKVFRAGFTTKKRGWGLGLTLVKRIVEEYHGGRVALLRSKPGETIFEILLPSGSAKGTT
jgi:signal transduction histidine kinase